MDDRTVRLECLKLVYPKNDAAADPEFYIYKAGKLAAFVTGDVPKRRGRPPKSDKPDGPDENV